MYIYIYIYIYIYTYTCKYIYTHTHIYITFLSCSFQVDSLAYVSSLTCSNAALCSFVFLYVRVGFTLKGRTTSLVNPRNNFDVGLTLYCFVGVATGGPYGPTFLLWRAPTPPRDFAAPPGSTSSSHWEPRHSQPRSLAPSSCFGDYIQIYVCICIYICIHTFLYLFTCVCVYICILGVLSHGHLHLHRASVSDNLHDNNRHIYMYIYVNIYSNTLCRKWLDQQFPLGARVKGALCA